VLGHDAAVAAVGFAADGARVSTYSLLDGTVRLWSVAAETRLGFQLDHPDHVWDLDVAAAPEPLAPDGDALLLATAGFDGGVRVWRYERQRAYPRPEPLQALQGHDNRARQVRFAPGGRLLSSAGYDGTAIVHDLVTEQACTLHVTDQERGEVYNALFGPGARWLLATSNDPEAPARLFSVPNCEPLSATSPLPHSEAPVQAAAVHHPPEDIARVQESDSANITALILTGDDAGIIRLFRPDGRGGWQKTCELAAEVGAVGAVALSPDAAYAAVAGGDSRTALLEIDPAGAECTLHKHLVGHTGRVYSVRFGPDGKRILTASLDKTARVWTLDGASLAVLTGHQDRIYRADFSPDGDWILTASRDGSIRLWRAPAGVGVGGLFDGPEIKQEFLPLRANVGGVAAAAFSPDGHYLAGAYWENAAILWRIWRDGDEVPTALRRRWGPDRARLALISEAYRFRTDNALVDAATRSSDDAAP
jgi:WD40 repeat protein